MSDKNVEQRLAISFGAILAAELLLHLCLKMDWSRMLRVLYLSSNKRSSRTMFVDNYIPCALLGFLNGWFGCRWTIKKLTWSAILLAAVITSAQPLYSFFFPRDLLWWWPLTWTEGLFWFATGIVFSLFFTHLGRNFQIHKGGRNK